MTAPVENQAQDAQVSNKELNFRNLEARFQKQLEQERSARVEAERKYQEATMVAAKEEDDDLEPYVDHRKLDKKLAKFGQQQTQVTQSEIQKAVQVAIQEERNNNWVKQNSDFYEVLKHADKLALKNPDLAESILEMPEGFERQKLVYKTIKSQGLHNPDVKQPSIQDKIDANRRSPYYQPSGVGTAPYTGSSDFSAAGQKQAYEKMKQLQQNLRM